MWWCSFTQLWLTWTALSCMERWYGSPSRSMELSRCLKKASLMPAWRKTSATPHFTGLRSLTQKIIRIFILHRLLFTFLIFPHQYKMTKSLRLFETPGSMWRASNFFRKYCKVWKMLTWSLVGDTVKWFIIYRKDKKMALLQLPSVEDAAEALIKMHNHQLRENSHLRVSFSKSTI